MNGQKVPAGREYSVELVSPILTYEQDIKILQEIVRVLRKTGAFSEKQNRTGIHIHLNGNDHSPRSLRNFVNIIYSRNDLLYDSLQIERKNEVLQENGQKASRKYEQEKAKNI